MRESLNIVSMGVAALCILAIAASAVGPEQAATITALSLLAGAATLAVLGFLRRR